MDYKGLSFFFDFDHPTIQEINSVYQNVPSDKEKAISLYNDVRDNWRYDPYTISLRKEDYRASIIAQKNAGNCVEKSILLVACLRGMGIPARLHLGSVKNHIAAERLIEKFGSNELTPHGMVNVYLYDRWLKLSPAFNTELCLLFQVAPLEFDGEHDSYLQQYNAVGDLFMEYVDDYGHFPDVPMAFMIEKLRVHYPHVFNQDEKQLLYHI